MVRSHGVYQSATKDSTPAREDIGEAVPFKPAVGCTHPLMQPNLKEDKCIFSPRMDVGR
jgi:hypothetical protein